MKSGNGFATSVAKKEASKDATSVVNQKMNGGGSSKIEPQKPTVRYSDEELAEFKVIVLDRLEKAQKEYVALKAAVTLKDSNGTDDTFAVYHGPGEEGQASLSREDQNRDLIRLEKFIQYLNNALIRIENKTYGVCIETGQLISKERLRAVPITTKSMDAEEKQKGMSPVAKERLAQKKVA